MANRRNTAERSAREAKDDERQLSVVVREPEARAGRWNPGVPARPYPWASGAEPCGPRSAGRDTP
jgi:hypothetical protein